MALQWSCWQAQVSGASAYGPTTYSYVAGTMWERYFKMSNSNQNYDGAMGAAPCSGNDRCFYGWFTQQTLLTSGNIGDTAPYMGLNVVQLVG